MSMQCVAKNGFRYCAETDETTGKGWRLEDCCYRVATILALSAFFLLLFILL